MLPTRSPIEKATVMIDFPLENSQASERKSDELAKARKSIPSKRFFTSAESSDKEDQKSMNPSLDDKFLMARCHSIPYLPSYQVSSPQVHALLSKV